MIDLIELDLKLSQLQDSSLNSGGSWKIRRFEKNGSNENPLATLTNEFIKFKAIHNLELITVTDWKKQLLERINHWSHFEPISKEEMMSKFSLKIHKLRLEIFLEHLNQINLDNSLVGVSKINASKFDMSLLWGEQISDDFIFEYPNEIMALSLGWSS